MQSLFPGDQVKFVNRSQKFRDFPFGNWIVCWVGALTALSHVQG
jgi:hypothetical protein